MPAGSLPLIAVLGAIDAQGGATARALLQSGAFGVRALTRRPQAATAQSLAGAWVEVVRVDLDDLPSLRAALARALGEPVRHHSPSFAEMAALPFPGVAEMANMFRFLHDFNDEVRAMRSVAVARELHPGLLDFDAWLALNAKHMPVERRAAGCEAGLLAS